MDFRHLHFVQSLEPLQGGGLGRAALALHLSFRGNGTTSALLSTAKEASLDEAARVYQLRRTGLEKMFWSPDLAAFASRELSPGTVVHGHGFYSGLNFVVGKMARKRQLPFVYHVHGIFEPWILRRSRWKKRIAHWLFEDANYRHARLWRALHAKEADQIRVRGITAPVVIAPNGINLAEYDEAADPPPATQGRRRMLFLARIHPKKGLDLLIPAWARLASSRKDWELLIVGPDEGGYKATVEKMIRDCGVADCVSLHGVVSGQAKTAMLKSADVFILPSYSEGFSVAILEALACRVPVIATDACNFPELAQCGAGWECKAEPESLESALRGAFFSSGKERAERGQLGRRLIEQNYSESVIAKTILDACAEHCR